MTGNFQVARGGAFHRRAQPWLGTLVEIKVARCAMAENAVRDAFAEVARLNALLSFHDPASETRALNRLRLGESCVVSEDMARILGLAQEMERETGGLFSIGVADVLAREGMLSGPRNREAPCAFPFHTNGREVRRDRPAHIDLGGVAKGRIVDCALEALKERGVPAAVVNAGGDLAAFGCPFAVKCRHPARPGVILPLPPLENEALATTAATFTGTRGQPARTRVVDPRLRALASLDGSVSVIAPSCAVADALTKCLVLAPDSETALAVLRRFGARALCFTAGDGTMRTLGP